MSKNDLGRLPFRTDGRLLVSYPKSGRTWLRYALEKGGIIISTTHAGASTKRREIGRPAPGIPVSLGDLPLAFLYRDPIDTAVSMFYQVHKRDLRRFSGRWWRMQLPLALRGALPPRDIDSFVLHSGYGVPKICAYNRDWLYHLSGRTDCLVLRYEDMRKAPAEGFQSLLDFFGETGVTGKELADISSFDKMKKAETHANPGDLLKAASGDPQSAKVRRGIVGGYVDELRPETITRCREIAESYGF